MANKLTKFWMVFALLLTGCAVGPDFKAPASPATKRYIADMPTPTKTVSSSVKGVPAQRFLPGRYIPEKWWELFQSPELNALVEYGVANSPNIEAAQAALKNAADLYYAQIGATLLPSVTGSAYAQRQRFNPETFGSTAGQPSIFNLYNAQVNVTYTLDVFGGARRSIEALLAKANYQQYELEATYLTLVANIVTTALTEASLRGQIKATHDLIQAQAKQLKIVTGQFELGGASKVDVLLQKTQLAQTEATLPPLEKSLVLNRHLLSLLVGELPSENQLPEFTLDNIQLPPNIPLSLPSLLVRKRPDVRASEALLHQASAQIGVATANMLPQFTINGYYGWLSDKLSNLFTPANVVWSIQGTVTQALFQGGSLFFKRRAAIEAYNQACAQYRQVVLQAFQNVADALRTLEKDAQTLQALAQAEKSAWNTLILTERQYRLGGVNYLNLLIAERQYQQALINRIQAQGARYTDTAALFQALGGGWWNCDNEPV